MAMYFMDGKTFLKEYINEDPRKVMKTQFVVVSSTIRKNGKYKGQILNATDSLMPSQHLIVDYDDDEYELSPYMNAYLEQIEEYGKVLLATIIKYAIEEQEPVVFLCGERETKYRYFQYIQEYVLSEFEYYIYNYKKLKKGKEKIFNCDEYEVIKKVNKVLKDAEKEEREKILSRGSTRKKYINEMSKDEMKKELKKRSLYYKGMSKHEMRDTLDTFL